MAGNYRGRAHAHASQSFARESRQPGTVQGLKLQLEGSHASARSMRDSRGNDPYNTSGSFDRTQNWARVGKR
jgi:hypothetical protein